MKEIKGWEVSNYYVVFKEGDPMAAENFVRTFAEMKQLLLEAEELISATFYHVGHPEWLVKYNNLEQ